MKFHLELAKHYWKSFVKKGDTIIDATSGNGQDALFLAKLLGGEGHLSCYDIQKEAIEKTSLLLQELTEKERSIVHFHQRSHETFLESSAALIVYNLGYLPGGDKALTTLTKTTLKSLKAALSISQAISITCYPGHAEGLHEEKALLSFLSTLPFDFWETSYHHLLNREKAPSLIWIQRR